MHLCCFPSQVEGINGMYLANKLLDNHIKTFITYNKGQTWALLPAPAADVAGNNLHCILVSLSLWAGVNECSYSCKRKLMKHIIYQMFQPHQLCFGCSFNSESYLQRARRQLQHHPPELARRCSAGIFSLSV